MNRGIETRAQITSLTLNRPSHPGAPLTPFSVTLGKSLSLFQPWFSHSVKWDAERLLPPRMLSEKMEMKHLAGCTVGTEQLLFNVSSRHRYHGLGPTLNTKLTFWE